MILAVPLGMAESFTVWHDKLPFGGTLSGSPEGVCCFDSRNCQTLGVPRQSRGFTLIKLNYASMLHVWRREVQCAKEYAEAVITFSNERGFIHALSRGISKRGWALAQQEAVEEGLRQLDQGLATLQDTGTVLGLPQHFALLAEAYMRGGQVDAGLHVLTEALEHVD